MTANLGLRYDFQRNAEAPDGAAANLLVEPTPRYVMAADRCNEGLSPSFLAQAAADGIAIECDEDNMLVTSQKDMFAPRLGLSYTFTDNWVVRAGGGLFYLTSGTSGRNGGNNLVHTQLAYPYAYGVTITSNTPGAPIIYGDGSRGTFESGPAPINIADPTKFNAFNVSLGGVPSPWKVPVTTQYNVTVQHQLSPSQSLSVGYVGSQSRNQDLGFSAYNYNAVKVMAPPGANANSFRVFPNFNGINQIRNVGKSEYNALQTDLRQALYPGLCRARELHLLGVPHPGPPGPGQQHRGLPVPVAARTRLGDCAIPTRRTSSAPARATICRSVRATGLAAARRASSIS